MPRRVTVLERRARLAIRHRLAPTGQIDDDVVAVARSVVALHATDPSSVVLSAIARMRTPDPSKVEHALYEDRCIVRMHAMRRTMFTCATEDAAVLQRSSSDAIAAKERKRLIAFLEANAVAADATRWLGRVEKKTLEAIVELGEVAARDLTKVIPELAIQVEVNVGKRYAGTVGVSSRVLTLLGMQGRVVRVRPNGNWTSSQHRWAPLDTWLGAPLAEIPLSEARIEIARRWLEQFGPGTVADLQWWTGWTLGATRAAIAALDTEEVDLDGTQALVLAADSDPIAASEPWVALLPGLDATTMGWQARDWYLGAHKPHVFDRNGNGGATVWIDGRIVGGWAQRKSGEVAVRLLEDVGAERAAQVETAASDLQERLGDVRIVPRFPAPLDKELSA